MLHLYLYQFNLVLIRGFIDDFSVIYRDSTKSLFNIQMIFNRFLKFVEFFFIPANHKVKGY